MRLAAAADRLVRTVGQLVAWSGLLMVLLIAFDVIARYLFAYGSVALQEGEWHLLALGALFGMSYGLNQGEEVRVDVLYDRFSPRAKLAVDVAAAFLLVFVALAVAWLSLSFVARSYGLGEGSADPGGLPWRWLLKAMIPAAFVLLAIQAAARCVLLMGVLLGSRLAR